MKTLFIVIDALIIAITACLYGIVCIYQSLLFYALIVLWLFLTVNIFPSAYNFKYKKTRLRICAEGADLLCAFLTGTFISVAVHIAFAFIVLPEFLSEFLLSCVCLLSVLSITFWNGIIRVYLTSVQLGIKYRVIGALCGLIPIVNLIALAKIIKVCYGEVGFENEKILLNKSRACQKICKTKYPILLVHGVFFRDFKYLNYWGRIPNELKENGAEIFYGNHQSALSVADSAAELTERIKRLLEETGYEKVNIIAHSKGGLDCRYAISHCKADKYVASLTTINTPHRGCLFADYLLDKVPENAKNTIAKTYNTGFKKLGDSNPDFLAAVYDLTDERCEASNKTTPDSPEVYYQSVGSKLNKAKSGKFPLNFTYHIAKYFDGANDGLVSEKSFKWGDN
ncbi:MAG: triacylglycerol lipase, partial [Clostridia bacterium]|nr:triacylglycerol lipase [Clostridia bacterium]